MYVSRRRAYFPRTWPLIAVALTIVAPIAWFGVLPPLLGAGMSAAVGVVIGQARMWLWRRQHPIISNEQMLQDRRDAARWN